MYVHVVKSDSERDDMRWITVSNMNNDDQDDDDIKKKVMMMKKILLRSMAVSDGEGKTH